LIQVDDVVLLKESKPVSELWNLSEASRRKP